MKRLISIVLTGILFFNSLYLFHPEEAQGAVYIEHQAEADVLYRLGVFNGTQKGFELERIPTRAEGAVMLVRLLGQEDYALQTELTHPFQDVPNWADPYVAYLYQEGLTTGTSTNNFSPYASLSVQQYMSFILRSLAYSENLGDFTWNESLQKASQTGILDTVAYDQLLNLSQFRRDHMVWISYLALQSKVKDQDYTLLEKLVEIDQVISSAAAETSGLYGGGTSLPPQLIRSPGVYSAQTTPQLQWVLETALLNMEPKFKIYMKGYTDGNALADFETALKAAQQSIIAKTGIAKVYNKWHCLYSGNELEVTIEYVYSDNQFLTLKKKVREIVNECISDGMSDYKKEKALHDHIINNAEYDYENFLRGSIPASSYTAYGVLILGRGVCQGYAEAMHMLCCEAGLKSLVVQGTSIFEGKWYKHAWNIVSLNGQYYQVDVCWDDVIAPGGKGTLSYTYFNLNDQDMSKDHNWNKQQYPSCTATKYNYYVYNQQQVRDYQAFKVYLANALERRTAEVTVRVVNFNKSDYADLSSLMFSSGKVKRYNYSIDDSVGIISIYDIVYN
ncbi:putative protease [hydrocarbon metagenome]|uniref:Putative protease n=1 Tax=hydrocarbon metagenome TaxID=938273 RepID=A0A0W8E4R1_9ZZZZ